MENDARNCEGGLKEVENKKNIKAQELVLVISDFGNAMPSGFSLRKAEIFQSKEVHLSTCKNPMNH
jgi:hypothetical protein